MHRIIFTALVLVVAFAPTAHADVYTASGVTTCVQGYSPVYVGKHSSSFVDGLEGDGANNSGTPAVIAVGSCVPPHTAMPASTAVDLVCVVCKRD